MNKPDINLKWVLKSLPKSNVCLIALFTILSSFEAVLNGYVLGGVTKLGNDSGGQLFAFFVTAAAAYVVTYVSLYLFLLTKQRSVEILNRKLKYQLFLGYFGQNETKSEAADLINRVSTVSKQIEDQYFNSIFMGLQTLITALTSLVFILRVNVVLGIIYLLLSALSVLPSMVGQRHISDLSKAWSKNNAQTLQKMSSTLAGRRDVIIFGVVSRFAQIIRDTVHNSEHQYRKMLDFQYLLQCLAWIIAVIVFLVPIGIGVLFAHQGWFGVTIAAVVTLALTADSVVGGIRELLSYHTAMLGTQQLRVANLKTSLMPETSNQSIDAEGPLTLSGVSFQYGSAQLFDQVDLTLNAGEKVIITGPSGVGKTTLLNLIAGWTKPYKGEILYAGRKIRPSDVSIISQNVWIFAGTVRDNVTLYRHFTEADIQRSLQAVGLTNELGESAADYQLTDNGDNISGGQAQRIEIARSLLSARKLFLVDEATSNLDQQNADAIRRIIYQMPVTMIEVAHQYNLELAREEHIRILNLDEIGLHQGEYTNG
jgi:ATP-binding cassette subfamily B protein